MKIFLSYRRDDSRHIAARIYDRLVVACGSEAVFKDVDSIPLGVDFRESIKSAIAQSHALLAVVGSQWLTVVDKEGKRRLDHPDDVVRLEIEAAVQRGIRIIPLFVDGAAMPGIGDLPESLREFAFRNGMPVRPDPDFHADMDRLARILETIGGEARKSGYRILVLDEMEIHRRMAARILAAEGHSCVAAGSIEEALTALAAEPVDLAVIQARPRKGAGIEAAAAIRGLDSLYASSVPILCSASDADVQLQCVQAGMDGHISRPITVPELREAIARHIEALDLTETMRRIGGDKSLLADLIAFALEDVPAVLLSLESAIADADRDLTWRSAHSVKGLASNFSARGVVESAGRLEKLAQTEAEPEQIAEAYSRLRRACGRLLNGLRRVRPGTIGNS